VLLKNTLQVITLKDETKHTFRSLQAVKKATHLIAAGQKEGPSFMSICYFHWYKIHLCCFGPTHRGWLGVKHQQE